MTKRNKNLIQQVDSFLESYTEGAKLRIYISSVEKNFLEEYVHNHPKGGKDFQFQLGIAKPGHLEWDFTLRKI